LAIRGLTACAIGRSVLGNAGKAGEERRQRMIVTERILDGSRYARCIDSSKRVRWDIDEDVISGPPL